jgi:hypothetical protein
MSKTQDLHDKLVQHLEHLVTGDDWSAMMRVASRFHSYSASNIALIHAQRPDATRVAGYHTWKKLGRQVQKGAHGIAVIAPCPYVTKRSDNDEHEETRLGFRVAWVFDEADTEGSDLPEVAPTLLSGESPDGIWNHIAALIIDRGYTIDRDDCSPANGVTRWHEHRVSVSPHLAPAQAVKTLTHELGHIIGDHGTEPRLPRPVAEIEAESIAYIVCAAIGIESDCYSFPYVAHWSDGDINLVRTTADRVVRLAHEVITNLNTRQEATALA